MVPALKMRTLVADTNQEQLNITLHRTEKACQVKWKEFFKQRGNVEGVGASRGGEAGTLGDFWISLQEGLGGGAGGRESACQGWRHRRCGFDPWVGKIPWRRKWQSTPVFLPRESHGQKSLAGYSLWGHKESDTTEVTEHTHSYRRGVSIV